MNRCLQKEILKVRWLVLFMLEPCQTSKMVLFCKNSLQLKSSNYDITQQTFVFKRRFDEGEYILIDHTSSENVFKTSSRRLGQDQYIRYVHASSRRLEYVFKMSSRRLAITSSRRFQDIFKTSSKRLQEVSQIHLEDIFKTF